MVLHGSTTVSEHFNKPNHSTDDVRVTVLKLAPVEKSQRIALENHIIFLLKSNEPPGLNINFSFV